MFEKFRDETENKLRGVRKQKLKKNNSTTTSLLNSIRKRQLLSSVKQRINLRKKLNLSNKQNSQRKHFSPPAAPSQGDDVVTKTIIFHNKNITIADTDDDDDDDCVLIEPQIEQIVIDDEQPSMSLVDLTLAFNLENRPNDGDQMKASPLVTSTPLHKNNGSQNVETIVCNTNETVRNEDHTLVPAAATTEAPVKSKEVLANDKEEGEITDIAEEPLFYVDTKRTAWFESINSTEAFGESTTRDSRLRRRNMISRGDGDITDCYLGKDNSSVIVVLDESSVNVEDTNCELEDSVVFVNETKAPETGFIPLQSTDVPNPNPWNVVPKVSRKIRPKSQKNSLFNSREARELSAYNNNAYNPAAGSEVLSKKRLVLIDGSNVAFNHGLNQVFSVKGLEISINYFEMMGHEVKAVVPQYRLQRSKSSDPETLEKLHRNGKIVFTPCKQLPGMQAISYDDRFTLQLACTMDAAIVSNDNYRDLIHENAAFKKIIENRVIGYTWCNDIFILPKDPYGRLGPQLDSILYRS